MWHAASLRHSDLLGFAVFSGSAGGSCWFGCWLLNGPATCTVYPRDDLFRQVQHAVYPRDGCLQTGATCTVYPRDDLFRQVQHAQCILGTDVFRQV